MGTRARAGGMLEHADVTFWWVAVGAATFPVLFFVSAPYGKLVRDGWGGRVDGRLGWFVQEIPSPVVLTLSFLYGGELLAFSDVARAKTPPERVRVRVPRGVVGALPEPRGVLPARAA